MGNGEEIAEERLLRMIEGKPSSDAVSPAGSTAWNRMGKGRGNFWQRFRLMPKKKQEDSLLSKLKLATRLMWVFLLGLGAFIAYDLTQNERQSTLDMLSEADSKKEVSREVEVAPVDLSRLDVPLASLIEAVVDHNPFTGTAEQKPKPKVELPKQSVRQKMQELAADLRIVGIDRSENPQVMVEDAGKRRTFFLSIGDQINGLEIVEIGDRGVVLGYEGQELLLN